MSEKEETKIIEYEIFDDMNLDLKLLRGIYAYGFEKPSSIQKKAIIPFFEGRDIIAQAQSGTGKTGAFSIGILSRINVNDNKCQALILVPTRELASQILGVISDISVYMGIKCHLCVGGTDRRQEIQMLKSGVHIIIGTPGRVFDMINSDAINSKDIKMFVLDEADEMLDDYGFQDIVYDIMCKLDNNNIQIGLFSATMPPKALKLTEKFMRNPVKIIVKAEQLTLEGIRQFYVNVDEDKYKFETLCDLYSHISIGTCVIFCNSQYRVDELADNMMKKDFSVKCIHGSVDPLLRKSIMSDFRSGKFKVLITTDLLSRGIDVQHVSIVINYDIPKNTESYLHRIGRSGRFGRKGVAINFVAHNDVNHLRDIEVFYNTQIEELPVSLNSIINNL